MNKNKWKQCCIGILGVCLLLSCQKSPAFDVDKSLDYCVTQVERSLNQLKPYLIIRLCTCYIRNY